MCRIVINLSEDTEFIKKDLIAFFLRLERIGGRDGNGIFFLDSNKLYKSVRKMPRSFKPVGRFFFHTRLATKGLVRDYNCQPFVSERYVLVHNGTMDGLDDISSCLGIDNKKYSDSYIIFRLINAHGLFNFYATYKDKYFGVIIVHDRKTNTTYLMKNSGVFEHCMLSGSKFYASSELNFWDKTDPIKQFGKGMYILRDNKIIKIYQPKKEYTTYYGGYDNYSKGIGSYNNTPNWRKKKKKTKKPLMVGNKPKYHCTLCYNDELIFDNNNNLYCKCCGSPEFITPKLTEIPNNNIRIDRPYYCPECNEETSWILKGKKRLCIDCNNEMKPRKKFIVDSKSYECPKCESNDMKMVDGKYICIYCNLEMMGKGNLNKKLNDYFWWDWNDWN